jgi:hypothetical protein
MAQNNSTGCLSAITGLCLLIGIGFLCAGEPVAAAVFGIGLWLVLAIPYGMVRGVAAVCRPAPPKKQPVKTKPKPAPAPPTREKLIQDEKAAYARTLRTIGSLPLDGEEREVAKAQAERAHLQRIESLMS